MSYAVDSSPFYLRASASQLQIRQWRPRRLTFKMGGRTLEQALPDESLAEE